MGMLATVMNALALADAMNKQGLVARVMSAIAIEQVVEPYVRPKALAVPRRGQGRDLRRRHRQPLLHHRHGCRAARRRDRRRAGAQGHQGGRRLLGRSRRRIRRRTRYTKLSFDEAMAQNLGIMDATAFALCRDQKLPIKVFSIFKHGALQARRDGGGRRHARLRLRRTRTEHDNDRRNQEDHGRQDGPVHRRLQAAT